jgi:hypothetical protein
LHVLAWFSLVVGMDSAKSGFAEVLWKRIIWLSQFTISVSKLTELMKRAVTVLQEVLAELCLILLFQGVNLTLVAIEAVIV